MGRADAATAGAFGIRPAGMLALDVARVEAGLLLIDVDFHSSRKALIESQKYSPFEMGLGRLVQLEKAPFIGREALVEEQRRGSAAQNRRPRHQLAGRGAAVRGGAGMAAPGSRGRVAGRRAGI